jgi:hypothetical protein
VGKLLDVEKGELEKELLVAGEMVLQPQVLLFDAFDAGETVLKLAPEILFQFGFCPGPHLQQKVRLVRKPGLEPLSALLLRELCVWVD